MTASEIEGPEPIELSRERGPTRQCAWTRQRAPKESLVRLVLDPEGRPWADIGAKAPGRGVYVCPDRNILREALSPKGLGRMFRGQAKTLGVDPEVWLDTLADNLAERILDLVGIARRANELVFGMDSVLGLVQSGLAGGVVVTAADFAERSERRIAEALDYIPGSQRPAWVVVGNKMDLGARLGRDDIGVVAIRPSVLAERVKVEARRHERLARGAAPINEGRREAGGPSGARISDG